MLNPDGKDCNDRRVVNIDANILKETTKKFLHSLMAAATSSTAGTTPRPGLSWNPSSRRARSVALVSATYVQVLSPIVFACVIHANLTFLVQQEIPRGTPPQSKDCPSRQPNRKPPQPPPAGSRRPLQRKGHPRRRLQPSGKHGQPSVYGGCCCQGGREERSQPWYCSAKLSW